MDRATGDAGIRIDEVDGVPTMSFAQPRHDGPIRACLMFGVGKADETLPVSGVTHVVEHLALQPLGRTLYQYNGGVGTVSTRFQIIGSADEVRVFVESVTGHLADLPVDRLAHELSVLRIEEEQRQSGPLSLELGLRFGPRGAGLVGYQELGFKRLDEDEVGEWARTWFTASNAALWIEGPIPAGLNLADLPHGERPVRAEPPPSLPGPRTWSGADTGLVSISVTGGQATGAWPGVVIAAERGLERLRKELAVSYTVAPNWTRIGGDSYLYSIWADGTSDVYRQVFDELVAVIDELVTSGPTADELERFRHRTRQQWEHPEATVELMDRAAERHLLGAPLSSAADVLDKGEEPSAEQVRDQLAAIMPTALAIGPRALGDEIPGWTTFEVPSPSHVEGRTYFPIEQRAQGSLVVGAEGVSRDVPGQPVRTVRWNDAVACLTMDNGSRTLVGPSGLGIEILPFCWQQGYGLSTVVDDAIAPEHRIPVGEGANEVRLDPDDPLSVVQLRWLGSLIGARYGREPVDVVIYTDGLALLHRGSVVTTISERDRLIRSGDPAELLAADPRNQWVAPDDVELPIDVGERTFRMGTVKGTLTLYRRDGSNVEIQLLAPEHLEMARSKLPILFGPLHWSRRPRG